jgi:hypothetical protein
MKKILLVLLVSIQVFAQTGIGTTTPNASAKLDVYATNKGFLPPRVTLTSATDATTIASPAEGLLVYNLGSVGLQAGYYYWNGANWATIATATSAGNGVTASNMVNLYGKGYSTAAGDIANASGYSFTVPVSGRYLFDFSSSGYMNQSTMSITFKVRQGTTDLATDVFTNANNNVHVVFTGMVEVNLQAGTTYNVYVSSTGSRDTGDYDRVFYKLVAGNLPVTGQTVDYVSVQSSADIASITAGTSIKFNTILGGNIPYDASTGLFTLTAGKTYRLTGVVSLAGGSLTVGPAEAVTVWRTGTAASGTNIGNYAQVLSGNSTYNAGGQGVADIIYTPTSNTTVSLYVNNITSTVGFRGGYTNAIIEQIGSSAIINPWVLTGNDVYNNTGKVGIGNTAPTAKLDVTGDVNVTGKINLTDPTGNVITKMAAFANENVPVTLGEIQVQMAPSGLARSLQIKTTGTAFTGMVTAYTSYNGASGTNAFTYFSDITQTINSTFAHLGTTWGFAQSGDVANYFVRDITNQRFWRITLMVGPSFNTNFIIIERLL